MKEGQFISDIQHICQSNGGKLLSEIEAETVARAIASVRDIARHVNKSPRHLLQTIFENGDYYGKCYYPCDVVQLRQILEEQKIRDLSKIILFSNLAWQKIIRSYKCILILSIDPEKINKEKFGGYDTTIAGGMTIVHSHEMDIKNNIRGIILSPKSPSHTVKKIVSETLPTLPVYEAFMIPGIDREKFASFEKLKKFVINLESCGINNQVINAKNEEEAVQQALDRAWGKNPDKKFMKERPARYTVGFWKDSGWWESIIYPERSYKSAQANGPVINLTDQEQRIFNTILSVAKYNNLKTTFRVAGGWVRDKILGKESDDIDIALDNITGSQFYKAAERYKNNNPQSGIDKHYTVDMNVEKSKHLETVAVYIWGQKIDFVNLRSESYGSDSRIPKIEFGTPEIDAQRRDLTINALFYNIATGEVEDYVGGLKDLQSQPMTLRTPLDPIKTFSDDPLRMLRVLRFNARYPGSIISREVFEAMANPQVQEAYSKKVAPERAGPEIYKMLTGPQAALSVRALFTVGLDKVVFDVPETKNLLPLDMDQRNKHHKYNLLEHTLQVIEHLQRICFENNVPEKERALMLFAAIFHDYGKAHPEIGKPKENDPSQYGYVGHEDASAVISEAIGKRIGFSEQDRNFVNKVVSEHMRPHSEGWTNKSIGRWLQRLQIPGQEDRLDMWKYVFMHAEADTMGHGVDPSEELRRKQEYRKNIEEYLNRPKPIVMKPLLDGSILMQMFPKLNPKPNKGGMSFIKDVQNRIMDEQLDGKIFTRDEAITYVESIRGEIENLYSKQKPPMTANRWYDIAKTADASAGMGPEGYTGFDQTALGRDEGIVRMIRRHPGDSSLYTIGDRIRRRRKGMTEDQEHGHITKKKNNIIWVKWDDKQEIEEIDLHDIETHARIERV